MVLLVEHHDIEQCDAELGESGAQRRERRHVVSGSFAAYFTTSVASR